MRACNNCGFLAREVSSGNFVAAAEEFRNDPSANEAGYKRSPVCFVDAFSLEDEFQELTDDMGLGLLEEKLGLGPI